jgi:hypothetical protein
MILARTYPNILSNAVSPGFIDTNFGGGDGFMKKMGATLTPEQGTVSIRHCLKSNTGNGWYYGSDGLRSPFTAKRDPGAPEYNGN